MKIFYRLVEDKKEGTNSKIELLQSQVLKLQCLVYDEKCHNVNLKTSR